MERRAPNNQMDKSSQGRLDWKNTKDWGIDLLPEMDSLPLVSTFAKQFFNLESPSRSSPCLPLWFHHIWFTYSLLSNIYFPLAFFSPKKHRLFTLLRYNWYIISSVQSLSRVRLFATPWIAACQASLSITNSRILLKLMSIESVMPSSHLILCCPLPDPSQHQGLFQRVNSLHEVAKVLEFQLQHQSFQWTPRTDLL